MAFLSRTYGYLGTSSRVTIERLERTPNTTNIECQIIYWITASSMAASNSYAGSGPPKGSAHQAPDRALSLIAAPNEHAQRSLG